MRDMVKDLKWYYLVAFIAGGLALMAAIYFVLRASGLLYKLTSNGKKDWIESGE